MYTQKMQSITVKSVMALDYGRPGKQILPKQNNPIAHLYHHYLIRLIGQH